MCGIVGYIGRQEAQSILLDGLKKLEYRGYDSAGLAVYNGETIGVKKKEGRIVNVESLLEEQSLLGSVGIAHTRWATHGKPSDRNSHPHMDHEDKFAIVHNGIIENFLELKEELQAKGHTFRSETDTEVIAHLLADAYNGDVVETVQHIVKKMEGAYALAIMSEYEPDKLVAVRLASPLIIGVGEGENFIASDIPAILKHTREMVILEDGEMAVLTDDQIQVMTTEGEKIDREPLHVDWDIVTAEKDGYDHFMLKEIYEQPKAIRDTLTGRIKEGIVDLASELTLSQAEMEQIDRIHFVACGTAYHAGIVGKYALEQLTRIPVEVDVASEYRYRDPIITERTLVIVISQSGETADTLAAMREAQSRGAKVLAITNVVGSTIARDADEVLITSAGPEIAVASTKAYTSQLVVIYQLGLYLAHIRATQPRTEIEKMVEELLSLPLKIEEALKGADILKMLATELARHNNLFFIGRGLDFAVALEGSLKLKELTYIHSEAYPAGELKHGTLALIEEGVPVISLATQAFTYDKMVSNIEEVKTRGAHVLGITTAGSVDLQRTADEVITVPQTLPLFSPVLTVIPLQLLSYYACIARGFDVDKPRNLAKSVTVE
ncbi:glutamine--fructose-6-phosphate transaminase (isomerizing) [Mechercharimyces sp. CAU 1602]|uniref:glutamine--fructose-6-phosphate transaminase (isomerizing) n=1 Tax=Mechercharimyces sp. CAU 1602 TaxID=2973933 RepID=UPI002162885B|nr:glutamine--fructose-6-phosphate transaminase (isomerizing) [Mechercharimyces sp. CAU 1602]MCS1352084.1 glutamine--fructose-6-phosphate transaminase (isomerizing) [Mechercharimyces sp. CAU 1602]